MPDTPPPDPRDAFARHTKDELVEELLDLRRERDADRRHAEEVLAERTKERDAWRDHKLPDIEAQALAGAVKALDTLPGRDTFDRGQHRGAPERILRFLAARYNVEWPTPALPEQVAGTLSEDVRMGERVVVDVRSGNAWRAP